VLRFHSSLDRSQIAVGLDSSVLPPQVNWIDALDPTPEETGFIERVLALAAPNRERMSEIETSSRLYSIGDTLYLTIPMIYWDESGIAQSTPLAYVLGEDPLLRCGFDRSRPATTYNRTNRTRPARSPAAPPPSSR
jgi:Mg2+ and Co2+ transporter CorA